MIMNLMMVFLIIYGCLFRGDFAGFYFGNLSYVGKFVDGFVILLSYLVG